LTQETDLVKTSALTALAILIGLSGPANAANDKVTITGRYVLGCKTHTQMDWLDALIDKGDQEAFAKLAAQYVAAKACQPMPQGLTGSVMDRDILRASIKVRLDGETDAFWVHKGQVK
jgi:hypothetical protein